MSEEPETRSDPELCDFMTGLMKVVVDPDNISITLNSEPIIPTYQPSIPWGYIQHGIHLSMYIYYPVEL